MKNNNEVNTNEEFKDDQKLMPEDPDEGITLKEKVLGLIGCHPVLTAVAGVTIVGALGVGAYLLFGGRDNKDDSEDVIDTDGWIVDDSVGTETDAVVTSEF